MVEIDVRGFSCPIPVAKTDDAIDDHPNEVITVLVDAAVAKESISRLAQMKGYSVKVETVADGYRLKLTPLEK